MIPSSRSSNADDCGWVTGSESANGCPQAPLTLKDRSMIPNNRQSNGVVPSAEDTANGHPRTLLHVGCGMVNRDKLPVLFRDPVWREIRLDIDSNVGPDVVASMIDMSRIQDESVDAIWSSHNLEHLHAHEVPRALAEFLRVLKPFGFVLITLPDLQRVAELVVEDRADAPAYISPAGPISPLDMIYGHRRSIARGNQFMAHHTGFTAATLTRHLRRAGFVNVQVRRTGFDLWARARKPPQFFAARSGRRFHVAGCRHLRSSCVPIRNGETMQRFRACSCVRARQAQKRAEHHN